MSATSVPQATSERDLVLEHTFRTSAARVFAAYTDPKLIAQWWVPKGGSLRVDEMEVRPGGKYRFVQRLPNGHEVTFAGTYLEVTPVTRLVYTFRIEGQPENELTATVELEESAGMTHLTLTNRCVSKEARDAMVRFGAAAGAKMSWDLLAEVLGRT